MERTTMSTAPTAPGVDGVDEFVAALQRELREQKLSLLDAEFLAAVEAGSITRDRIRAWAEVFYAATRNGRVSLGNFYANSPDDPELRRELAENLYEEETGRISGVGKCHMDVFYDLLAAFGITPADANALPAPQGEHRPQGRFIAEEDFFVELSAYGFTVEAPNAEFCTRISAALRDRYGFTDGELTWFSMHASLDAGHGEEFQKYAARAAAYPGGLEQVRERTLAMAPGVQHVWDGCGAWRT
jgi:pyrroloquinoline-quinone synthase